MLRTARFVCCIWLLEEKLEAEVRLLQHQNTELQQDLRSFVKEEEKANLEMAFLEEERGGN